MSYVLQNITQKIFTRNLYRRRLKRLKLVLLTTVFLELYTRSIQDQPYKALQGDISRTIQNTFIRLMEKLMTSKTI